MKRISLITIFYLLTANFSFAASYPASCPTEAKSIVDAVGGCSAVDKSLYSAVYDKCCVKSASTINTPIITPSVSSPASAPADKTSVVPVKTQNQLNNQPHGSSLEQLPPFPEQQKKDISDSTAPKAKNAGTVIAERIKSIFSSFFRFFRSK